MKLTLQQIIEIVMQLNIEQNIKNSFCKQLQNGTFNEALFKKILPVLNEEVKKKKLHIKSLKNKENQLSQEINKKKRLLEEGKEEKKQLLIKVQEKLEDAKNKFRTILKNLYHEVKRQCENFLAGLDKDEESFKHSSELNEVDHIKKKLGLHDS